MYLMKGQDFTTTRECYITSIDGVLGARGQFKDERILAQVLIVIFFGHPLLRFASLTTISFRN